jgi:hypothetical protein
MRNPTRERRTSRLIAAASAAIILTIVAATVAGPILAAVRP